MSPPTASQPDPAVLHVEGCDQALRESEVRYRRLFEAAKDGIAILDADTGQIVDANPFLLDLLGYSLPEVMGRAIWEIGPFNDIVKSKAAFVTLRADRYVRYENLPLEAKDGRLISVEFVSNTYPVGSAMAIQCNIRSIAERKREEEARRQSVAARLAAAEAKERLRITRQIHDTVIQSLSLVNIKLGSVAGATGRAELREAQAEMVTARKLLLEAIAQCRLLMSDLTPPMLYELGLAPAMEDLIEKLRERHGAMISLEDDGKTMPAGQALLGLLFDAARELIVNAVKHAGPCQINCSIKQEADHVRVCVEDNGAGFDASKGILPNQDMPNGFGLFNTLQRVEGMGGRLEICSAPGHGTVATLTVPLDECRRGG